MICNCSEPSKIFKNDYSCLHECRHFYNILFGGYATPRKHIVFSRLTLNSYNVFYKGCAYSLFYKSDTATQNEIHISDITLTFVCVKYPKNLMEHLEKELDYNISEADSGIYYVHRTNNILPIQIIITSKLNTDENLWLRSLTNHLTNEDDAKKLITEYETNQNNKLYESVMDIIIRANKLI